MGYGQMLQTLLADSSDWVQKAAKFWLDVVDGASAGTLDAKTTLKDGAKLLQQGATVWWSLLERGDPLPPVVYFRETADDISGASREITLPRGLPDPVVLHAGPLLQLGGDKALDVADPGIVAGKLREVIKVKITGPSGDDPAAGEMYAGVVYDDKGRIIATVFAQIIVI